MQAQDISSSQLSLLKVLGQVNDPKTDMASIAKLVGQDAALSQQLLTIINQPREGLPIKVETLKQAIQFLGLSRLKFWLSTLIMRSEGKVSSELLLTSLMRAKFCELFAGMTGHAEAKDSYFLAGLFSNLDAYFRMPLHKVLRHMSLAESIEAALVNGVGKMGLALQLLKQLAEGDRSDDWPEEVCVQETNLLFLEASSWAKEVMIDMERPHLKNR